MELDCQKTDEALLELLYGEADDELVSDVEAHLSSCRSCSQTARELEATRALLSQLPLEEPPPLGPDDPVLQAAFAKAEEMGRSLEAAAPPETSSLWQRFVDSLRSMAMRPAFAGAFVIVLVAGVSVFFLRTSNGPLPDSVSDTTPLVRQVPAEELRAGEAPSASVGRDRVEGQPVKPPVQQESEQRVATNEPEQVTRRRARADRRRAVGPDEGSTSRSAAAAGMPSEPRSLVLDARQVESPPSALEQQAASPAAGGPIIAAPPLPSPSPASSESPPAASVSVAPQLPTPAGAVAAQPEGAPPNRPVRVLTPGQRHYQDGMRAFQQGRYRDAAQELEAFVRSPSAPSHLLPSGMHHLALSQRRAGNLRAAADTYDRLLSTYGGYAAAPQAMLEAAQVNARLGRWSQAERLLNRLSTVPGWGPRAQAEMARLRQRRLDRGGRLGVPAAGERSRGRHRTDEPAASAIDASEVAY